jgi:hypothetical protein
MAAVGVPNGTRCAITATYKSGPSSAAGLYALGPRRAVVLDVRPLLTAAESVAALSSRC